MIISTQSMCSDTRLPVVSCVQFEKRQWPMFGLAMFVPFVHLASLFVFKLIVPVLPGYEFPLAALRNLII